MSTGYKDPYGRTGIPDGMATSDDPLGEFIRRTIDEARVQVMAMNNPGLPPGMMPAVAIDSNEPLSAPELKFVMNAFVLKCADEVRREGSGKMPGMPPGMMPMVDLGPPPVPEKVAAVKLKQFVLKAAEFGLNFPPEMMPATGPETVLPSARIKPPEQKETTPGRETLVKAAPPAAVPKEAQPKAQEPAAKNDAPEMFSARPDKITIRQVLNPALIAAAKSGKTEEVRNQIRKGAEANGTDAAKETAVHAAAKGSHAGALRVLLLNGGDPFQKSADGKSAMDIIEQKKDPAVMAVLQEPAVRKWVDITVNMTYPRNNRPSFTP